MSDRHKDPIWAALRVVALKRDGKRCLFCDDINNLHVHHIKPLSMGGPNELFNLVTLCASCHRLEHKSIRAWGCCMIPGPDWEPYREFITIPEDVDRYRDYLISEGVKVRF
jgi:hypothetical protein